MVGRKGIAVNQLAVQHTLDFRGPESELVIDPRTPTRPPWPRLVRLFGSKRYHGQDPEAGPNGE